MKLSDIKSKAIIERKEPKYLETQESYSFKDKDSKLEKDDKLQKRFERQKQRLELQKQHREEVTASKKEGMELRKLEEREKYEGSRQYKKTEKALHKSELAEAKAKLATAKAESRKYGIGSKISKIGKGLIERTHYTGNIQHQKRLATDADLRRQIALQRGATQYEREQYAKYGVRGEGDGEMPYYEKEHKRPLPQKPQITSSTITNGHRIKPKKSLRDELF